MKPAWYLAVNAVLWVSLASTSVFAQDTVHPQWAFPAGKNYVYEYTQEMVAENSVEGKESGPGDADTKTAAEGAFVIKCAGDSATLCMELHVVSAVLGGKELSADMLGNMSQTGIEFPMEKDGTIRQGRYGAGGNMQFFIDLLFPLPVRPMKKGEDTVQDMVMFASGMSNLEGKAVFTYNGTKDVDGVECLDYHVSCHLESETIDAQKQARASLDAETDCLFSQGRGCFVSVKSAAELGMDVVFMPSDFGGRQEMSMLQRHKSTMKLRSIEDAGL